MIQHQTENPDEFQDVVRAAGLPADVSAYDKSTFRSRLNLARWPRSEHFTLEAENLRAVMEPSGFFAVTVPLSSTFEEAGDGKPKTYAPGAAHIWNPQDVLDIRLEESRTLVACFFPDVVNDYAGRLNGTDTATPFDIGNRLSLRTDRGQSFLRYLTLTWREISQHSKIFESSLVAEEIESTLLTLLVFAAEDQARGSPDDDERSCPPAYLRQAEDYIAAHLLRPMSLADIAEAAGISARTLTRAFRNRHGVSPIAYLRRLRLESARSEFLTAEPGRETVTCIAVKHGFYELGRFAKYYRDAFGELPSDTLQR